MFAPRRVGFALVGALVFILYGFWFTSTGDLFGTPAPIDSKQTSPAAPIPDQQSSPNITNALPLEEWEIEGHNGLSPLCRQTKWTEGLWLHCHNYCGPNKTSVCGGLNNARNRIQTCIRLAIDAGAGLILPSATERDEDHLVKTNGAVHVCPEVFFNTEYLQTSMHEQCPQFKLRMCDDRTGIKHVLQTPKRHYLDAAHSNGTFRQYVEEVFERSPLNLTDVSATNPAVVNFGDSFIGWDYRKSGEVSDQLSLFFSRHFKHSKAWYPGTFRWILTQPILGRVELIPSSLQLMTLRKALFKVIKFNQDLLNLSSKIGQHPKLNNGAYIGVHLRGEKDWPNEFGVVADQMRFYVAEIQRIQKTVSYNLKTIYVSVSSFTSSNRSSIAHTSNSAVTKVPFSGLGTS